MSGNSNFEKHQECTVSVLPPDAIIQHRLDAVDVLKMTLEDVKFHFHSPSEASQRTSDVSSLLERVGMCCRFIDSVSWSDRSGVVEKIILKLIGIHINLANEKPIVADYISSEDWFKLEAMITAENNLDTETSPKTSLLDRDYYALKIVIVDRITRFLLLGPLAYGNHSTFKLLEQIELCRRYLCDNDVDMKRLERVSVDITVLLSMVHCYEIMEFWETINFKKWSMKSVKAPQNVFDILLNHRKMYPAAEIKKEKKLFENYWRKVLSEKSPDYRPPTMTKGYPDHPYLSYEKRKRSISRRKCRIKSATDSTVESMSEQNSTNSETNSLADTAISSNGTCRQDNKTGNANSSSSPLLNKITTKRNTDIHRKDCWKTVKNIISVVQSERKTFTCKLREQLKLCDVNLGATKSPMFIRVGVPQHLLANFYTSLETFFLSEFNKKRLKDSFQLLQTVSSFKKICSDNTKQLLVSLRDHVTVSILDIISFEDPRREVLVNQLMVYIALRVEALLAAVDQFEKCCVLLGEGKGEVVEMARSVVKEVFKKLAIVCCTDKLVVSSDW